MTAILPMTIHVANCKAKTVFCANATKAAADKKLSSHFYWPCPLL